MGEGSRIDSTPCRACAYVLEAQAKTKKRGLSMAAVYKVGKKWREDFIDKQGIRHRQRFSTKGEAEDFLTEKKAEIKDDVYVAPKNIPTFGQLADQDRKSVV